MRERNYSRRGGGELSWTVGAVLAMLFVLAVIFMPGNHRQANDGTAVVGTSKAPATTTGSGVR